MDVYLLWHAHDLDEEVEVKLLGVYSTDPNAEGARERAKSRSVSPGRLRHFSIIQTTTSFWTAAVSPWSVRP
jgi:hypothetical protein